MAKTGRRRPRGAPKTKSDVPGAKALAGIGHNSGEQRETFLHHRTNWRAAMAAKALADKRVSDLKKLLKRDGFTVKQFQIADDLETVTGEEKLTTLVRSIQQVAVWQDHPLGRQLDMFQPSAVPFPFEAGRLASMSNKPRKPPHAPGTESYDQWMNGYAEHQSELAAKFKPKEPKKKRRRAKQPPPGANGPQAEPTPV